MRVFLFVLAATVLEAVGDAIIRVALTHPSMATRVGLFLVGGLCLTLYGTSLNLAPVDFATVTGTYVAMLFVMFQVVNYLFFRTLPTVPVAIGAILIVAGGLVVTIWAPPSARTIVP
ncbi:MAG TPA: hypothetical protein VEU08_00490 [Vicinamibacterales bacterium]|nr:hypothetical protein [Vicinamibacterales bacterium]